MIRQQSKLNIHLVLMCGGMLPCWTIKRKQKDLLSNNFLRDKQKMSQDFPFNFIIKTKNNLIKLKS